MTKRTIPAGEFKAHCLKLMDDVAETGEEIVITKRGKPVARLLAAEKAKPKPREFEFGYMRGTVKFLGDVIEPIYPDYEGTERWDRLQKQLAEEGRGVKKRRKRA